MRKLVVVADDLGSGTRGKSEEEVDYYSAEYID